MHPLFKHTVCGLLLITLVTGCATYPAGEEVEVAYMGVPTSSDGTFQMDGRIAIGGGAPEQDTFKNVKIKLYTSNGTQLCGVTIGDLDSHSARHNVSLRYNTVPEYVIITSPDFWDEKVSVNYFQRRSDSQNYTRISVSSKQDLPVSLIESNRVSCT